MQSYIEGFFCHYALDRTAHPYVFWFQEELAAQRPRYGRAGHTIISISKVRWIP